MPDSNQNNVSVVKCRNCGCICTSNFCPDCGQSTHEKRLENKSFFIGLLAGLSRINQRFLFTAWQLLIHPWIVIRDYIRCRRVRYVKPISMLVVVCFITAFVSELIPAQPSGEVFETSAKDISLATKILLSIANSILDSTVICNLTIYIPALLAIPLVYSSLGAKRYNLAEYFVAMIYMTSAFLLSGVILAPVALLSEFWYSALEITYSILISSVAMYKAFPIDSVKKRVRYFILYLLVSGLIYFLIIFGFAAIFAYNNPNP